MIDGMSDAMIDALIFVWMQNHASFAFVTTNALTRSQSASYSAMP